MERHYLNPLFNPTSVLAYLDHADENGTRATLARNLAAGTFSGRVIKLTVCPDGTFKCAADDAGPDADLAVIGIAAQSCVAALEDAGRRGARAAIVVTIGLAQIHADALRATARRHGIHMLGPHSLGMQRPPLGLNASIAGPLQKAGQLGLVSQSGALTSAMLDWGQANNVGFSAVVSLGRHSDVDLSETLDFLATDARTHSILVYMEGIHNARSFLSSLRAAARSKPVIVLKAGRKPSGTRIALTHSGAMVGGDDVFDTALRRAGAVRVQSMVQLFSAARCLASRYKPVGNRLGLITNGGGPAVLAADYAHGVGIDVPTLSADSVKALRRALPDAPTVDNPIDLGEYATPEDYLAAVHAMAADADIDGILVMLSPKADADVDMIAQMALQHAIAIRKPVIACWMGGTRVAATRSAINASGIPVFRLPEAAVDAFSNIASFYRNQRMSMQMPAPLSEQEPPDVDGARILIESGLAERRQVLTEMESKSLLSAFSIPVTKTIVARTATEAIMLAEQIGFPVVMKINSPDISHKSDVGGVVLNVRSAQQVRAVFSDMLAEVAQREPSARIDGVAVQGMVTRRHGREIYVGMTTDELFGPVITFGAGGTMIELIADRTVELPPLNTFLAQRMIERSRVATLLGECRGMPPVDAQAIVNLLLRVSEMICELPWLRELDINPIIADEHGVMVVDARIVIDRAPPASSGRYSHLAILPYPSYFTQQFPLPDGNEYSVRAIRPEDAENLQAFVRGLSEESRYFRFISTLQELSPAMLARFTQIDYHREMALIATLHKDDNREAIIGVARYMLNPDGESCEFALVVGDEWQGRGIGSRLMLSIMDVARAKGLKAIRGLVLVQNSGMLKLMTDLGFNAEKDKEDLALWIVTRALP